MSIGIVKLTSFFPSCRILFVSLFCWLSISFFSYVFPQTNNFKNDSDQSISRGNNSTNSKISLVIKPENTDSDQENIGREAKSMIMEITKSNILYEKNKSSANLAFVEQKLKDRKKHNKKMKEYNEIYNKKYLASFKRFQKMRGKHAEYSGVHSDYSAYLQQFLTSSSR